jgi:hypothetical protein
MLRKHLMTAALLALVLGALASAARADDTIRLDLRRDGPAGVAGLDGDDDIELVRGYRRFYGGYGYGYRPYFSYGYRSFYGYGFGYRPYYYPRYYSYYAPSFSFSFGYARPFAYSYFYAPPVYYSPYYYCPINGSGSIMPYATSVGAQINFTVMRPAPDNLHAPTPLPGASSDGTYPYDGGPLNPVPMPSSQPAPKAQPTVPLEGRPVSLPAPEKAEKKYTYPAYGEGRTLFAQDRTVPISTPARR